MAPLYIHEKQPDGILEAARIHKIITNIPDESKSLLLPLLENYNLSLISLNPDTIYLAPLLPPVRLFRDRL